MRNTVRYTILFLSLLALAALPAVAELHEDLTAETVPSPKPTNMRLKVAESEDGPIELPNPIAPNPIFKPLSQMPGMAAMPGVSGALGGVQVGGMAPIGGGSIGSADPADDVVRTERRLRKLIRRLDD